MRGRMRPSIFGAPEQPEIHVRDDSFEEDGVWAERWVIDIACGRDSIAESVRAFEGPHAEGDAGEFARKLTVVLAARSTWRARLRSYWRDAGDIVVFASLGTVLTLVVLYWAACT